MVKIKWYIRLMFYFMVIVVTCGFCLSKINQFTSQTEQGQKYEVTDVSKIKISEDKISSNSPFRSSKNRVPVPPSVPGQPGVTVGSNEIQVLGTLPPDVVILSKNGHTLTAKTGDATWLGVIGKIYLDGCWIDGEYYPIKK